MKIWRNRRIAMLMAFVLIVPLFWNMNIAVASAATPTFVQTNVEIIGEGQTYQLEIKDQVAGSKYSWTSSNTEVAKVTSKGLVTAVAKGTSTITCKITYPTKKTKTLSCKITVTIPAKQIKISNAVLVNGAHVLMLGKSMDFNCDLTPAGTSDKVFWSIGGGDEGCIRIDDAKEGKITAIKAGKVILVATAAKTATKETAALSLIRNAIIVEVVGSTATVKSAEITGSTGITVVFDSPVQQNTVIGANGVLSENIELTMGKDAKGVLAADPGKLTATLSADQKTLTIKTEKVMSGYYGISCTSNILTTDGAAITPYYRKITYIDLTPPAYAGTTTDDTGMIATINFTEPINFSNLKVSGAQLISTAGETANPATISTLNNVMNYTPSEDKRSLTINLSKISSADYGKLFSILISGITDNAGNIPAGVYIQASLRTDTSGKPQARIISVQRTGYNTITATFDRAIRFGGYAQIEGGSQMIGDVDLIDTKKVNYTIPEYEAALYTGAKKVSISFWDSYNVLPADNSANKAYDYYVDFTADVTSPVMLGTGDFDAATGILTLTYNEAVTLTSAAGIFVSTFASTIDDIKPNTNINYTKITHTAGNNIIKLQLTGISLPGTYSFTLEQGFVTDNFRNKSVAKPMVLTTISDASSELPKPYSIVQSSTEHSKIILSFPNKLDKASAENINNYKITGIPIVRAELSENSSTGATVILTVADSAIKVDGLSWPITISGVKGYNDSYAAINFSTQVTLLENEGPVFRQAVFDKSSMNNVRLDFSEQIQGTMTVRVLQTIGSMTSELPNTVLISGSSIYVNISLPSNNALLRIEIISNNIKDMSNNPVGSMPPVIPVQVSY
jgi:hypothetical protein